MISKDTSCRPHEILKLNIKDLVFKSSGNTQYAEVLVCGKTGSRHIPLINSIPFIKDWLDEHPRKGNINSPLICGLGKSLGRYIQPVTLDAIYEKYKTILFPKLLEGPNILQEDQKIEELKNNTICEVAVYENKEITDGKQSIKGSLLLLDLENQNNNNCLH